MAEPTELDRFVDTALGLADTSRVELDTTTVGPAYKRVAGTQKLCVGGAWCDAAQFIDTFVAKARDELGQWTSSAPFPGSNWKWRQVPAHASHNASAEVRLERAIIQYAHARGLSSVANQIPVASGFNGPLSGRRSAIDLAVSFEGACDLIELKMPAPGKEAQQPPLAAAVELLKYFAAYADARERAPHGPTHPIFSASRVRLCVLGPDYFYRRYDLARFERFLKAGLAAYSDRTKARVSFVFQVFPKDFRALAPTPEEAFDAFSNRGALYGGQPDV